MAVLGAEVVNTLLLQKDWVLRGKEMPVESLI